MDYSNTDYTRCFDGTSAAAPHVAGIAALILSEYPDLPQEMVRRAIEMGCSKLSGYTYYEDQEYPSDWRNDEVGYGLVNAPNALNEAYRANQQHFLDATPGIDFTITNNSSYLLDDIIVDLSGSIGGENRLFDIL
jgi:subtilisin family serine protease